VSAMCSLARWLAGLSVFGRLGIDATIAQLTALTLGGFLSLWGSYLGAAVVVALPSLIGWLGVAGLATGGLLYVIGAIVYASGRPNPWPKVFGYHEVFHALVLAAAALQYAVIAFAVLPHG